MQKLRQISIRLAFTFKVFVLFVLVFFSSLAVYTYTRTIDPNKAYAATSSTLNFQGRLLSSSGNVVPDGNYNLEFKIYDGGTNGGPAGTGELNSGTLLWTETRDFPGTDDRVRVVNGYFSVNLGSVTAFPGTIKWNQEHWLTMNVGGSGTIPSWDGEMLAPSNKRTKLTAVPYAFEANSAKKLLDRQGSFDGALDFLTLTANRNITLPDQDGTICIQGSANCVDVATTNTTANTNSNSGLEISSDGLRLLGGCSNGQILKWNNTSKIWQCDTDNGSPFNIRETDGSPSNSGVGTLEFGPTSSSSDEFIITDQGSGVTRVRIGNGVALLADNETVTGLWTYTSDQTLNLDNGEDLAINLATSGTNNSQAETVTLTNSSTSATQYGLYLDNAPSTGTTDALLVLDNSDTDTAVTSAIQVINAGGGFTNLFDIAGTLISVNEFTLLDGRDGALVDTNDAVATAITGTGALDAGSITTNFGAINVGADAITTTGTVSGNDFDRSTGGALTFGNTNATSVSLCNSGNCDTITIGTNADADTIQIGDSNDTVTITGGSGSTIVWNGVTVDATEFNRLDGKDAALVDQNDFTSGDGAGGTSGGSGLEAGTGGIGLLQGCANNEGLVWNDVSSIWACSLPTLDSAYTNDSDKILSVNNTSGLSFDLTTTGGLFIKDSGTTFATFTDTGGITFAPLSTSDITFTLDDDSNLNISGTITNDGQLSDISFTLGNDANADTLAGLRINATSAVTGDADTLIGLLIANLNSASAVTESALQIGTGWDNDLVFNDTTALIKLGATDNTASLSISDSSDNNLLELKDLSTNFGSYLEAGAVAFKNSYLGEEFNRDRVSITADTTALVWGDDQAWSVDETAVTGDCSWNGVDDAVNGITIMQNLDAGSICNMYFGGTTAGDQNMLINGANLPLMLSKVLPSNIGANDDLWVGYQNATQLQTNDEPDQGIFFTNNNGTTWTGVTKTSDANRTAVTCTGETVSTIQYAVLKIEVVSTSLVNFYVDSDVSNGVNWVSCGSASVAANIPAIAMTSMLKWTSTTINRNLQIDYYRVWQDDAPLQISPQILQVDSDNSDQTILDLNQGVEYVDPIEELKTRLLALESKPTTIISPNDLDLSIIEVGSLNVVGSANFNELVSIKNDLNVLGYSTVQGLTVNLDLIVKGAITVEGKATFKEVVRFEKDVEFASNVEIKGELKTNEGVVGTAKIEKDKSSVKVTFKKPKSSKPIITVSLGDGKFAQYSYKNVTPEGFEIILLKPASEDLEFSWVALQSSEEVASAP